MDRKVEKAVEKGISRDKGPLELAVDVVVDLEDEPEFNAGTGSRMRLDGSIQMDAAVMYDGDIGAVSALEDVKNPVKMAREVYNSPYVMLCGSDATAYAKKLGLEEGDLESEKRREELEEMRKNLSEKEELKEFYDKVKSGDTVGCVVECDGGFAAAVSTGGTDYCVRGRVGDSPMVGCGFYAGERGAVVTTGKGEELVKRVVAKRCYDLMCEIGIEDACEEVVEDFPTDASIGVIAVDESRCYSAASNPMASYESKI